MVGRERAAVGAILSDKRRQGVLSTTGHLVLVANLGAQKAFARSFTSTCVSDEIRTRFLQSYRDCPEESAIPFSLDSCRNLRSSKDTVAYDG
eukprot:scaffold10992_cov38-Prasinocladus_malaysianus.AAC.1